jgi:hypothetical protein
MTRIRWTAGRDGIAHAHTSGRTACHAQSIGERDAWPTIRRCPRCVAIVSEASPRWDALQGKGQSLTTHRQPRMRARGAGSSRTGAS